MRATVLVLALSTVVPLFAQGPPAGGGPPGGSPFAPPAQATVNVNCARQKIGDALKTPAVELTIVFTGVCTEDVVIRRNDVTLRGGAADATIDGSVVTANRAAITIDGALRVTLADFAVRNSDRSGIWAMFSSVTSRNLTVSDTHDYAVVADGCAFRATNTTISNASAGIVAGGGNAEVTLEGTTTVSGATDYGVLAEEGAQVFVVTSLPSSLHIADSRYGVVLVNHAHFSAPSAVPVVIRGGEVSVFADAGSNAYAMALDASGASLDAVFAGGGSIFSGGGTISAAYAGIEVADQSILFLRGMTVAGAEYGIYADDGSSVSVGTSTINGSAQSDVWMAFGSRLTLRRGNTIGSVTCEPTAIARPNACTPMTSLAPSALAVPERPRVERPVLRDRP